MHDIQSINYERNANHPVNNSQEVNEIQETRGCQAHLQKQFERAWAKCPAATISRKRHNRQ